MNALNPLGPPSIARVGTIVLATWMALLAASTVLSIPYETMNGALYRSYSLFDAPPPGLRPDLARLFVQSLAITVLSVPLGLAAYAALYLAKRYQAHIRAQASPPAPEGGLPPGR